MWAGGGCIGADHSAGRQALQTRNSTPPHTGWRLQQHLNLRPATKALVRWWRIINTLHRAYGAARSVRRRVSSGVDEPRSPP